MAERINIGKFINNLDTEDLSSEKLQGVVNNVYAKAIKDKRTRDKRVADATKDQGTELVRFVKSNHDRLKAHKNKPEKDIDKDDAKVVETKGEVSESLSEAAVSSFPDRSIFNKVRGYEKQHLPSGFTFADVDTMRRVDRIGGKSPEDMCDIIKAEIYYGSEDGRELCTEKTYKVFDDGRVEEISQLANEEEPVEEAYIRKEIGSKELWDYINQILKRSYRRLEDEDGVIDPYDIAQILENKYDISGYDNNVTHLVEDIVDALHWWGKDELSKYNLQLKQAPDNDYYLVPTGFEFDESLKEAKNNKRWWVLFFDETGHNRAGSEWSHAFNTPPITTERRILAPDYVKPKGAVGYMILSDSEFNALDYDEIDKNYKRWGKKLPINESLELKEESNNTRVLVSSLVVDAPKAVKRIRYGSSPWHTKYFDRDEYDTDEAWVEAATTFYRRKIRDAAAAYKTYDPDQSYDFRFGSPFARVILAACYGSHRKQRLLSEDKYQVGDGEFTNGSTPNLDKWIADGYLVRQAFNSDKRVPLLQVTAGGSGEEVEEALNGQGSFSFIDTQSGQKFGPYDTIGIATNKANQYGGPGLVIIDNTNRKWYRLANGKALPMGTIPAGFDLGEEAGAAKKAKNNTICEEDDRFAEQKAQWEELSDRIKVIEFDNGDYYYIDVDWEKGTIFAGSATNTGVLREFEINLDPDLNIDENIAELYDYIVNQRPDLIGDQFEEDLQEAQATGDKPQANPNFNKEKFGKYFNDKGQLKPELRDEYFKAVRVDKQNARRGKRGMPFNKIVR